MERLSISSNHKRGLLFDLRHCHKLTEIQGLENWEISTIQNQAYDFKSHLQCPLTIGDDESRVICIPGSEVPNWFSHRTYSNFISFHVPSISKGQFPRLFVCVVSPFNGTRDIRGFRYIPSLTIRNETRGNEKFLQPWTATDCTDEFTLPRTNGNSDHVFLYLTALIRNKYELESGLIFNELVMESGDEITVFFGFRGMKPFVEGLGVLVVVDEPNVM
ncbi:uncharacterized protein LOC133877168 [Alnus glutinosa]|uniref:uncharacterized protein LOC133877168 n=1 Tax=Alnus glutinosa TaxID=3517 RepID=UPI002D79BF60|nr:uncharacterized protein LOC133877168 [Alnus glutinosa]